MGDYRMDGVWSHAGEEEPGRAIQNEIFLCVVFLFFCLAELGRRRPGCPALKTGPCTSVRGNVVRGQDLGEF